MNVLFFGTPDFAVPSLHAVAHSHHTLVGVVTAPDMPAGRGLKIRQSAVKEAALNYDVPLFQFENLEDSELLEKCAQLKPDVAVVVAFRKLPEQLWKLPTKGTFNLHASILPDYRGAAPLNWAIINGETETGLTTFFINEGIDTGNIINTRILSIDEQDNLQTLHDKLAVEGAKLVVETLDNIETGNISPVSQQEIITSKNPELKRAPKIFKHHCRIDWMKSSAEIRNLIRGLSPVPGAFSVLKHKNGVTITMKLLNASVSDINENLTPGQVKFTKNAILVGTGNNKILEISDIQPESRKRMFVEAFLNGIKETEGWYFEN